MDAYVACATSMCVGTRHAQLLNDELDMEKVDTGMLALSPLPCDILAVLERCTSELRPTARLLGVSLAFRAFDTRDAALDTLSSGRWASVTPRALPHEGVSDLARYLGSSSSSSSSSGDSHDTCSGGGRRTGGGSGSDAAGDFRLNIGAAPLNYAADAPPQATGALQSARRARRDAQFGPVGACVSVDAARLQQVFYNLVMNAIRASTSGDDVLAFAYVVQAGPGELRYCIGVQDSGHGMDAARVAEIGLEPLQASLLSTTASYHGRAGLGLAFAKAIVAVRSSCCTRPLYAILFG
jgi:signal transduction histidine kinase